LIELDKSADNTNGLLYVPIPKNYSNWIKYHLQQACYKLYNYYDQGFDADKHMALIVLRDPIDRWISAMGQILVGNDFGHHMHVDSIDWNKITATILRNNHTQPQHEFFANIPMENIIWFRCDNDFEYRFTHYLETHGINIEVMPPELDVDNVFNVTKKVPSKVIGGTHFGKKFEIPAQQTIVEKITSVLKQNPEYCDRIKNLYQKDFELFNTVPYYDPR
jgi:hypothetical protein